MTLHAANVDRYELLGEIATGGMATVYLGRQKGPLGFTRTVAIKSMHPHYARDESFRAMFLDEATLTARIRHPNVVPTLDVVIADSNVLIVMEYVEGVSLSTLLRRAAQENKLVDPGIVATIMCDTLNGLHAAHVLHDDDGKPLHVVHRDVSPQNIHVGTEGVARVLDFGVAKANERRHVTTNNEIKGKLAYMSAEQLCGEYVDLRTDVYAAGVVLWESLTLRRLVSGGEGEMLRKVVDANFEKPSTYVNALSPAIDAVVMKALAAKREDRWASAAEMSAALAAAQPLAPRSAVAALVRELGASEIESRSERLRSSKLTPEAKMLAEVLTEHATETLAASTKSITQNQKKGTSILLFAGGALLVAGAVTGAFVVGSRRAAAPPPPSPVVSSPPPVVSSVEVATPPPVVSSSPPPVETPPPAPAPAPAPKTGPKKRPKPAIDCRVPYTTDANGDRHYRPECVD